jgi:hypothetical protein
MLSGRHTTPGSNPVDAAMAWHEGDPRATVDALLKDRKRLCEQLATAPACISNGYTRGWLPGDEFEGWMITSETSSFPGFVSEHVRAAKRSLEAHLGLQFPTHSPAYSH